MLMMKMIIFAYTQVLVPHIIGSFSKSIKVVLEIVLWQKYVLTIKILVQYSVPGRLNILNISF